MSRKQPRLITKHSSNLSISLTFFPLISEFYVLCKKLLSGLGELLLEQKSPKLQSSLPSKLDKPTQPWLQRWPFFWKQFCSSCWTSVKSELELFWLLWNLTNSKYPVEYTKHKWELVSGALPQIAQRLLSPIPYWNSQALVMSLSSRASHRVNMC